MAQVARRRRRATRRAASRRPPSTKQNGRLAHGRRVELGLGALGALGQQIVAEDLARLVEEHGAGTASQVSTAMPTLWAPWPGNRKVVAASTAMASPAERLVAILRTRCGRDECPRRIAIASSMISAAHGYERLALACLAMNAAYSSALSLMRRPRAATASRIFAREGTSCAQGHDAAVDAAFRRCASRKNPQNSYLLRDHSLNYEGFREPYSASHTPQKDDAFHSPRAPRALLRAPRRARQASNVAVPSSAETQGFARDGVSRRKPSARRRPGTARRRGGPAAAIQCNAVVRRGATVGFPRRCSAPRAASASRSPLLLKADPLVSGLSLYDVVNTPGVAADLSHCNTPASVTGVTGVGSAGRR